MKPFTHAPALGIYPWVPTGGSSKRLFFVLSPVAVLRTIVRARDVAARKESGLSLTQGERLREGSAPSDKHGTRLDIGNRTGLQPAVINKAAEQHKGQTPCWTPRRGELDLRDRGLPIIIV